MSELIELSNLEINEYCMLDITTGKMNFYNSKRIEGFTGLYFKDNNNFFAIYPTHSGPKIYYDGKEYPINKSLTISLKKSGKKRKFRLIDYEIEIDYIESPYIGFDVWSDEIDVDLFYMIEQSYQNNSFYEQYTF